jgi:Holliday junction resolvasome RuvABC endonuclease subunit
MDAEAGKMISHIYSPAWPTTAAIEALLSNLDLETTMTLQPSTTAHAAAATGAALYVVEYTPRGDLDAPAVVQVPLLDWTEAEALATRYGVPVREYAPAEVRAAVEAWAAS